MRFLVWGTMPIGALIGGILGSTIGVRETLLVSAIGYVARVAAGLPLAASSMRELPQYVEPLDGARGTTRNTGVGTHRHETIA